MPRARLRPLNHYTYREDLIVRVTDLNYGGHLGNDRLLTLIHEARVGFLKSRHFTEMDCGGVSLILGDAVLVYQGEAFAGDLLRFEVAAGEPGRSGFRLFYRVTRPSDNKAIALAETGMVCFDYQAGKRMPLPAAVKRICLSGRE